MRIAPSLAVSLSLLVAIVLPACSGLSVLNAVTPDRHFVAAENIAYAMRGGRRLDIYTPADLDEAAPVVVFFHGGRWSQGSKDEYKFVGEALSRRGVVVAIPDYRKYPEVRMAGFMGDAAQAVRWVRDNISQYGGDARRIFLMGHSSGAHMAALLALDARYLADAGVDTPPAGFIGLAGAYDFLPLRDEDLRDIFGPESRHELSQPVHFARAGAPPALLLHAEDDTTVWVSNAENLARALRDKGSAVTTVIYESLRCGPGISSHACTITALSRPFRGSIDVLDQVVRFIDESGGVAETTPAKPLPRPLEREAPKPLSTGGGLSE